MKLIATHWKQLLSEQPCGIFGQAQLVRAADGRIELRGGSRHDRFDALEYASLFLHDAVFDPACPAPLPERN